MAAEAKPPFGIPRQPEPTPAQAQPPAEPPVDPGAPPTEPQPQYVTVDDFNTVKQTLDEVRAHNDTLRELLLRQPQQQAAPAPASAPVIEDITDEELETAYSEGRPVAPLIRKAANASAKRETASIRQELSELRQFGVETMSQYSEQLAGSTMPYLKDPNITQEFPEIKKAIEQEVAQLNADLKTQPRVLKAVHDRIVGEYNQHITDKKVEAALRAAREQAPPATPTNATGRTVPGISGTIDEGVPGPEDLFEKDAVVALQSQLDEKGLTLDQWANRVGHKNWASYAELIQKQRGITPSA